MGVEGRVSVHTCLRRPDYHYQCHQGLVSRRLILVGIVAGLRARGFPESKLETLMVPHERHGFLRFSNQLEAAERTVEFLERWLWPSERTTFLKLDDGNDGVAM